MPDEILPHVLTAASEVFRRPVAASDNFFDLGGDSLCAIDLGGRLEDIFGVELDVADIFEAEDMTSFANMLAKQLDGASSQNN